MKGCQLCHTSTNDTREVTIRGYVHLVCYECAYQIGRVFR